MKLEDDRMFTRVENALRRIVPSFQAIRVKRAEVHDRGQSFMGNELYFDFHGASNVPAQHVSQGTLLVLSLLTIVFGPARPNLVLFDDIAHALHPRAQLELVKLLKQLPTLGDVADLQIVATTYSPHVLDELDPEDVLALALGPDGSVCAKRLAQHPEAVRSAGMLSSGQLWSLDLEQNWVVD
jgi:predicted ATPase